MAQQVIFLDRDGTLNVDSGFVYRTQDFHWIPGSIEAIKRLREATPTLAVVTNQSGVARGLYSRQDVEKLHEHMHLELAAHGTRVDAVAYCPHGPDDGCRCRKPNTGLVEQVKLQLKCEVDYTSSWMVGDRSSDIAFGTRLGVHTALIRSPYWDPDNLTVEPELVVDSLYEAAMEISRSYS
jgi:D-glycero-D-manno-heptose 1,7-bisphosphate phosphatase